MWLESSSLWILGPFLYLHDIRASSTCNFLATLYSVKGFRSSPALLPTEVMSGSNSSYGVLLKATTKNCLHFWRCLLFQKCLFSSLSYSESITDALLFFGTFHTAYGELGYFIYYFSQCPNCYEFSKITIHSIILTNCLTSSYLVCVSIKLYVVRKGIWPSAGTSLQQPS